MTQDGTVRIALQPSSGWRSHLRGESGSTLVETALSITILLVLVVGILDACLMVYSYHFISNAARDGARYAIVRGNTWIQPPWGDGSTAVPCASYTSAGCTASAQNIDDYVKSLTFPGIDTNNISTTTSSYIFNQGGTTTSCGSTTGSTPPACNAAGNLIEVKVQYNFATFIPFIPSKFLTMTSTSRMIISQ